MLGTIQRKCILSKIYFNLYSIPEAPTSLDMAYIASYPLVSLKTSFRLGT